MDQLLGVLGLLVGSLGLLAGLGSLVCTYWLERQKTPNLVMCPDDDTTGYEEGNADGHEPCKWLRVWVENKSSKGRALSCRGSIAFFYPNDHRSVFPREMQARWSDGPRPDVTDRGKISKQLPKGFERISDIEPKTKKRLDIVIKLRIHTSCYGSNDDAYCYENHTNPNWELKPGQYYARVTLSVGGMEKAGLFKIYNESYDLFHLDPVAEGEKERLMKAFPTVAPA